MSITYFILTDNEIEVEKLDGKKLNQDILTFFINISLPYHAADKM